MSLPNANSPGLLTRLLETVGRGVRSTRGLQESLGVRARTVQYYERAGEWLGFLLPAQLALSPLGLEYVYDPKLRPTLYAQAVWSVPFARELLGSPPGAMPDIDTIARAVALEDPSLAPSTVRRRASALKTLLEPAVGLEPRRQSAGRQLSLPLLPAPPPPPRLAAPLVLREHDPDVYRAVLSGLLDYGELGLGGLRALLDRTGVRDLPLGGYVDLALSRGDAERVGERLVVTPSALLHPEACESAAAVILTDRGFRRHLEDLRAAGRGDGTARVRRDTARAHLPHWERHLFGHPADPTTLEQDLARLAVDRRPWTPPPLSDTPAPVVAPFLSVWEREDLVVAAPPSLSALEGGLDAVNAALARARSHPTAARMPDLAARPAVVHGGLFHPGEDWVRVIPDARSLRLRLLSRTPYAALTAALLLLARRRPEGVSVSKHRGDWWVRREGRLLGALLPVLDRFATSRGWVVSRAPRSGLRGDALLRGLQAVGLVYTTARVAVLAEPLFAALSEEIDEAELYESLQDVVEALEGWLQGSDGLR